MRAEEDAAYVYRTAGLGGLATALAEQDVERARALASQLQALGMPIPGPARGRDGLPAAALAVLDARGNAALRAAAAYEQTLIDGCAAALGRARGAERDPHRGDRAGRARPAPGADPARGRGGPALIRAGTLNEDRLPERKPEPCPSTSAPASSSSSS